MKKQVFYNELIDFLEFEHVELSEKTEFKSLEGYDSLAVMSLIAFCDEKFNKKITAQQIKNLTTIKSLMDFIGYEQFED